MKKESITYIIKDIEDWELLVQFVLKNFSDKRIFLLNGQLGSGKTTFVQAFGKALGVNEHITSPTFTLVHEYHGKDDKRIYHLDLYRLKNKEELKSIGIEEMLYSQNFCFIEWPDLISSIIEESDELKALTLLIDIKINSISGVREIFLQPL